MKQLAQEYYDHIEHLITSIVVTNFNSDRIEFCAGLAAAAQLIADRAAAGNKLIFVGNGASAAISSHQATDFWKNGGIRAVAFNDCSGLTCISNDFGYEYVFAKPIEMFADPGDLLIAISSSGSSQNILQAVVAAKAKRADAITLSGFSRDNPLRKLGLLNFYVPSSCYGHVEILHLSVSHCLLDIIVQENSQGDEPAAVEKFPYDSRIVTESIIGDFATPKIKNVRRSPKHRRDSLSRTPANLNAEHLPH